MPPTDDRLEKTALRTILTADIEGFSGWLQADVENVLPLVVDGYYALAEKRVRENGGTVFRREGDAIWCMFDSAVSAVRAAVGLQDDILVRNESQPASLRFGIRAGIHLGDVLLTADGDVLGAPLSVAKRLETACPSGGINVSLEVHAQLAGRSLGFVFEDRGELDLKGIGPRRVYTGKRSPEHEAAVRERVRQAELSGTAALRNLLAADLGGWTSSETERTAWQREALRLARASESDFIVGDDAVAFLLLPPSVPPASWICSPGLAGPRLAAGRGQVLVRRDQRGRIESLHGPVVEEALDVLLERGRQCGVVLVSETAAHLLEGFGASSLEPAGLPAGRLDSPHYRVVIPGPADARLQQRHSPRCVGAVALGERCRQVDLTVGVDLEKPPEEPLAGAVATIWGALSSLPGPWSKGRPVVGAGVRDVLRADPGTGLAAAVAWLASVRGHRFPRRVVAIGAVSPGGDVTAPDGLEERLATASNPSAGDVPALLLVPPGVQGRLPSEVSAFEIPSLAAADDWLAGAAARLRLKAVVDAQAAGRLCVVVGAQVGEPSETEALTAILAGEAGTDPEGYSRLRLAEEAEEAVGREVLEARFEAWFAGLGDSRLAAALAQLRPDLCVTLFPDPRLDAALASSAATRHLALGGRVRSSGPPGREGARPAPVLTEADFERMLAGLADLDPDSRRKLATWTMLVVGSNATDPSLKSFFRQLRRAAPATPEQVTFLADREPSESEARWWERRQVQALQEDGPSLLEMLAWMGKTPAQSGARRSAARRRVHAAAARPFKFLDYFGPEDRTIFFGRDREIEEVSARLLTAPLLVVYGKSGAGKTSLLQAGVLSRLPRPANLTLYLRTLSEPSRLIREELSALLPAETGEGAAALPLHELAGRVSGFLSGHLVLVLDQFEEFFVRHPAAERSSFIDEVAELVRRMPERSHLVLSLREDFLAELSEFEDRLPSVLDNRYRLTRLDVEQARQAIRGPAELFGIAFEEELVDTLTRELFEEGIDPPQLQIVCDRLYAGREAGSSRITMASYEALGGVQRVLVSYLQSTLARQFGAQEETARRVMSAMITDRGTKAVLTAADLAGACGLDETAIRDLLGQLVEARLVRELAGGERHLFELAHEYIIQEVRSWLSDEELALRHARTVLRTEMENRERHGSLIGPELFTVVAMSRDRLAPSAEELEFLLRAAAVHGHDLAGWLASERASRIGAAALTALLDDERIAGPGRHEATVRSVHRRILTCLFDLGPDGDAAGRMVAAAGRAGHFGWLSELEASPRAAVRGELLAALRAAVVERFWGPGRMAHVPAGPCLLGSARDTKTLRNRELGERPDLHEKIESERDLATVELGEFWIDRFPVTQDEFAEMRPEHVSRYPAEEGRHPAVWVDWHDAAAYARWTVKELPTEQEWEKAARGTDGRLFPWGNAWDGALSNSAERGLKHTTAVEAHPGGASPYGCLDMAGNVWEWTSSPWVEGNDMLVAQKGGSTVNRSPLHHCSARYDGAKTFPFKFIGFRTVRRGSAGV